MGAVLTLLVALSFYQPYYFTFDDNATGYLPASLYNYRCLTQHGTFPFLNFHQYLGEAYYVLGTSAIFYLPSYLSTFFADKVIGDVMTSMQVDVSLHLFLAALATYAYLRTVNVSGRISAYGALLYITLPFWLCASKSWLALAVCAFYIPALLACLEAFLRTRSSVYLVAQCALKIAFVYHGNIQFVMIYGLGELLYLANRGLQLWPRLNGHLILSYLVSNLVMIVAALPLILPMKASLAESVTRAAAMPVLTQIINSVSPKYWFRAQLYLFDPEMVSDSSDSILFLGGCIFFLVCFYGVRSRLSTRCQPLWHLLLTSLLLSTVANVVLRVLPYFDRIRWPFKWYILVAFCYAAMSAVFFDEVMRRRRLSPLWAHGFFILAIASNLLVALSPISQVAFGPYHITPKIAHQSLEPLSEGRHVTYGIRAVDTFQSLTEIRSFAFPTLQQEHALGGYNSLVSSKVQDATFGINFTGVLNTATITPEMREAFNQWSVRYLIGPSDPRDEAIRNLEQMPGMVFLRTTPSGFRIYENLKSRPFAWAKNNPAHSLPIRFHINSTDIDVSGVSGGVVVSLIRLPGWEYRIDAQPWMAAKSETAYGQITVPVPEGARKLTLNYTPPGWHKSWLIAGAGLLLLIPVWYVIAHHPALRTHFCFVRSSARKLGVVRASPSRTLRWILGGTLALWLFITLHYACHIDMTNTSLGERPAAPMDMYLRLK